MNAIAELITKRMGELGYTRRDVAARMGYSDRGKAFRVFDACFQNGRHGGPVFRERLAVALQVTGQQLDEAFEEVRFAQYVLQAKALAATFTPHLWAEAENTRPSSIMVVALCGERRFREAQLSADVNARPLEEQKGLVAEAARAFIGSMHGCAGPFGRITGFQYRYAYGHYWRTSVDGEFIEQVHKTWGVSVAGLSVRGRDLVGIFSKSAGDGHYPSVSLG